MKIWLVAIGMLTSSSSIALSQTSPRKLDSADSQVVIYNLQQGGFSSPKGIVTITGERRYSGFFLAAEKIIFEPGAKLIFTSQALASRGNLFIFSEEIISNSSEQPGIISYDGNIQLVPPNTGSAPGAGGYPGDDNGGFPGPNGIPGNSGYPVQDGPQLTMVVQKLSSPLIIDINGQPGGAGGQGQAGGIGGAGGNGHPASQNAFNCNRGAGDGGRGGPGGSGGPGGQGSPGGSGGTFTLVTVPDNVPLATAALRVGVSGGQGGPGGAGGNPGPGGTGGQGGQEARPWCRGNGSSGPPGPNGNTGVPGVYGPVGRVGDFLIGSLGVEDLKRIFK